MLRPILITLVVAFALGGSPASARNNNSNTESIPPNCIIDPFTKKMECVIWPTCTLDPFTGKMNCPVPKARRAD